MDLDSYLTSEGAKSLTALSGELGISKGRLSQLRHARTWPPELALKVERATGGAVNAGAISPVIAEARQGPAEIQNDDVRMAPASSPVMDGKAA